MELGIPNPIDLITLPITTDNAEPHILLLNYLIDRLIVNQYDEVHSILEQLSDHDCRIYRMVIKRTIPHKIVKQLKHHGFNVYFLHIAMNIGRIRSYEDIINIAKNSPRPAIVRLYHIPAIQCLIQYYQLAKIPYILEDYYEYRELIDWLMELTPEEVDQFDECNEMAIHRLIIGMASDYEWGYILLRRSDCNSVKKPIDNSYYLRVCSHIPWVSRVVFNRYRQLLNGELFYTRPIFDQYWKELSVEDIVSGFFNSDHLQRIGIEVPHIDLILREERINLVKLKRLLQYSTPSREYVKMILTNLDNNSYDWHNLKVVLTIAQYKKSVLYEYSNHPLVRHLLKVSNNKSIKNAGNVARI